MNTPTNPNHDTAQAAIDATDFSGKSKPSNDNTIPIALYRSGQDAEFEHPPIDYSAMPDWSDCQPEPPTGFDELPLAGELIPPEVRNKPTANAPPPTPKFSLKKFISNGSSAAMKEQMLNDVFVLDGIALLGQLTVIYAKPNAGKTLTTIYMLKESIKAGRIKGEDVYYINADDGFNGAYYKLQIAEQYGFGMIIPNATTAEVPFKINEFNAYLQQLINDKAARGVVVVLDTLKKFTDLMDKKRGSEFMKLAREFSLAGGTMIMLAHTNKNRGIDGKVVAGGTSDISDDCCCAYTLDEVQGNSKTHKTVLFENFKNRGDVARELSFTYLLDAPSYHDLIESVQVLDFETTEKTKKDFVANAKREKDAAAIEAITEGIMQGNHKRTELIKFVVDNYNVTRAATKTTLDNYAGEKLSNSSLWNVTNGEKTTKLYYLLKSEIELENEYEKAKNG